MSKCPISRKVNAFLTRSKSTNCKALEVSCLAVRHALNTRDWTLMARLISRTDPRMSKQIKKVVSASLGGITVRKDSNQPTGLSFKLGDNFAATEVLAKLENLAKSTKSIFSEDVNNLIKPEKSKANKKSKEELMKQFRKTAEKHGYILKGHLADMPTRQEDAQGASSTFVSGIRPGGIPSSF